MFPGFEFLGKYYSSYAIAAVAGILAACPLTISRYKKRGGDDISMIFVLLFGGIGCLIGSHMLYGITNIQYWSMLLGAGSFSDFWEAVQKLFGGSVFYGGLIGGLAGGLISANVQRLDIGLVSDCAAPSVALFHMFGRIGCFLGGCCYGVEWEYGVTFTSSLIEEANGVPRVPVQLYEAGFELVLFAVLSIMLKNGVLKNKLIFVYLMVYAVGRFALEFWRGDEYRGFLFGLSTSQLISTVIFVAVPIYLLIKRHREKHTANLA